MTKNLAFFDSNVLISASIPGHVHHATSNARLGLLQRSGGACSSHTLAEAYNTLTAHPKGYGVPAADASRILRQAGELYTLVSLTPKETLQAIEDAALQGQIGGIVYDALLIACARKIDARVIYTNNVKHFKRIAPDLASRIHKP